MTCQLKNNDNLDFKLVIWVVDYCKSTPRDICKSDVFTEDIHILINPAEMSKYT